MFPSAVFHKSRRFLAPTLFSATMLMLTGCEQEVSQDPPPPTVVDVLTVTSQAISDKRTLPGRIHPVRVAEVRARVPGIIIERKFEEGADVTAGQILFQIDPAPFEAALAKAKAEHARAEASVFEASALMRRLKPLVARNAVSLQDFDSAVAGERTARAAEQSAKASVKSAQLELEYATVRAPISGRIGRAMVTEGALVGQSEPTPLAVIQQIDTVYADFTQTAAQATRLMSRHQEQARHTERVVEISPVESGIVKRGKLLFSDITVDKGTGQITLRGKFDNRDHVLLPGMYVRVTLDQGEDTNAILVPQRAVKRSKDGSAQVLIVDKNDQVKALSVITGKMIKDMWHITEGLTPGQRVIINGDVSEGDKVKPFPYHASKNQQKKQSSPREES